MTAESLVRRYSGYGLTIDSDVEMPEFPSSTGDADVRIRRGAIPERLDAPAVRVLTHEADAHRMLLRVPGVGGCLVSGGAEITIATEADASPEAVRAFIGSTALGTLLLQRGVFVLHAAACAAGDGAILLAGYSGQGKSTMLAALVARGHSMITDDVAAISLDSAGRPVVHPAFARMKLFRDSAEHLGIACDGLQPIRREVGKYPIDAPELIATPRPVRAVYVLVYSAAETQFLTPTGHEKLAVLRSQTYCRRLAEGTGLHTRHFRTSAALAASVPVVIVRRPPGLEHLGAIADEIQRRSA